MSLIKAIIHKIHTFESTQKPHTPISLTLSILFSFAFLVSLVARTGRIQAPIEDVPQQRLLLSGQLCRGCGQKAAPVVLHALLSPPGWKHLKNVSPVLSNNNPYTGQKVKYHQMLASMDLAGHTPFHWTMTLIGNSHTTLPINDFQQKQLCVCVRVYLSVPLAVTGRRGEECVYIRWFCTESQGPHLSLNLRNFQNVAQLR